MTLDESLAVVDEGECSDRLSFVSSDFETAIKEVPQMAFLRRDGNNHIETFVPDLGLARRYPLLCIQDARSGRNYVFAACESLHNLTDADFLRWMNEKYGVDSEEVFTVLFGGYFDICDGQMSVHGRSESYGSNRNDKILEPIVAKYVGDNFPDGITLTFGKKLIDRLLRV